jgi:hypothetical protein
MRRNWRGKLSTRTRYAQYGEYDEDETAYKHAVRVAKKMRAMKDTPTLAA